jgi:tRNA-specific 2-thiouridylase
MARIAMLASGGVDSSVALCRLVEEGEHQITAFYLKIWLEDELAFLGSCPWEEDLGFLREVCDGLDVPLEIVPLQRQYFETVIGYVVRELEAGRTPSPDVVCNRSIKFAAFVDQIDPSFELVASGHYARTQAREDGVHLLRGADPVKDQTYFLSQLQQAQLARCRFPIGGLLKSEVRAEAARRSLPNCDRPDSQGICFLGRVPYDAFIEFHLGELPGEIRELGSSRVLGEHRGYWYHTIGQRRGLGLSGGPWYVVDKDVARNRVIVVHADRLVDHRRDVLTVPRPNWIVAPPTRSRLQLRVRHGEAVTPCQITSSTSGSVEIRLAGGDPGIAPGQFAVLYDGPECLGGGAIAL